MTQHTEEQQLCLAFARVGPLVEKWLAAEKADAVKVLAGNADPVAIHRAQGKYAFAERIEAYVNKGKSLR